MDDEENVLSLRPEAGTGARRFLIGSEDRG